MANENLRAALQNAGIQPDELADIITVDPRSVRRWLNGTTTPYPRLRTKIARALDTPETDLWPGLATEPATPARTEQPADLVAAYPTATDLDAPDWKHLMRDATQQIDLLADTLAPILETTGAPQLLIDKATAGCPTRILIAQPGWHLERLIDQPGIEIHVLELHPHQTIHRYDQQLLVLVHLDDQDPDHAPSLHIRRAGTGGLFDRFTDQYEHLWEHASQPLDPDQDIYEHEDDVKDDSGQDPDDGTEPQTSPAPTPASTGPLTGTAPRRWPRRPAEDQ